MMRGKGDNEPIALRSGGGSCAENGTSEEIVLRRYVVCNEREARKEDYIFIPLLSPEMRGVLENLKVLPSHFTRMLEWQAVAAAKKLDQPGTVWKKIKEIVY